MVNRTAVQGWPYALVRAYAADMFHIGPENLKWGSVFFQLTAETKPDGYLGTKVNPCWPLIRTDSC